MHPFRLLLNVLWLIFGGVWMALAWMIAGVIMAVTIVGLPWARSAFTIARYTLLPFGFRAVPRTMLIGYGYGDLGTGPMGGDRQRDLARAGGMVAGARPSAHRAGLGGDDRRHPVCLGASETGGAGAVAGGNGTIVADDDPRLMRRAW